MSASAIVAVTFIVDMLAIVMKALLELDDEDVEPVVDPAPLAPVPEPVDELLEEPLELLLLALTSSPSSSETVRIVPAKGATSFVASSPSSASSTLTCAFW